MIIVLKRCLKDKTDKGMHDARNYKEWSSSLYAWLCILHWQFNHENALKNLKPRRNFDVCASRKALGGFIVTYAFARWNFFIVFNFKNDKKNSSGQMGQLHAYVMLQMNPPFVYSGYCRGKGDRNFITFSINSRAK